MKTKIWLGIALSLLLGLAALGVAQVVKADALPPDTPQTPDVGYGYGPLHGPRAEMASQGQGLLKPYMEQAVAEAFGLSVEELENLHESGTTLWAYASAQGTTAEEFRAKMTAAREAAIQAALDDGAITAEQAEWMQSRPLGGPRFGAPGQGRFRGSEGHGRGPGSGRGQGFTPNGAPGQGPRADFAGPCPWGQPAPNAQP